MEQAVGGQVTQLDELVKTSIQQLEAAGVSSPRVDVELLAGHVLHLSRSEVQLKALTGLEVSEPSATELAELVNERARRIPVQHLTGRAPFRTLQLRVGPGVFTPRPETEIVVEAALTEIDRCAAAGLSAPRVVDLGTGSGAIAAAIATERPQAEIHAVELSTEASAWAQLNFDQLPSGSAAVTLHQADLREAHHILDEAAWDIVISNPPYIPADMVPTEQEVREHDPDLALWGGGVDGLALPTAVVDVAARLLRRGGWMILEHAEVQADALHQLTQAHGSLEEICTHQDLSGRDRATSGRLARMPITDGHASSCP